MQTDLAETLRMFYVSHRQELFTYALSLTGCPMGAEDAVQTAFSRVLQRGRAPSELRPYLFRCVRNAAMDEGRARQRASRNDSIFNGVHAAQGDSRLRLEVEELFATLTADEREAVVLKVYSGMTFEEIGGVRGVPLQTAASWYRRGMSKLRIAWTREENAT